MQTPRFLLIPLQLGLRPRVGRSLGQRIAYGGLPLVQAMLVVVVALVAVTPALADSSRHERQRVAQRQEQDVSKEGTRRSTVTKSFSNDGKITVPAAGSAGSIGPADPYPSTIAVSRFKALRRPKIVDLNLKVRSFSHTHANDVNLLLVAPNGRNAIVLSDVGEGFAVTNITLTLDDEAAKPLPELEQLTSGAFRPRDGGDPGPCCGQTAFPNLAPAPSGKTALSTFDGINPKGTWQLFAFDDAGADSGAIADGWSLQIKAKGRRR